MRYACFTALLFVQLAGKVQNNYLFVYPTYISCLDLLTPTLIRPLSFEGYMLGYVRLIWCIYRWWTPGGTTREARTCHHHLLSQWSNWWWCRHSCFNKWVRTCRPWDMGMGMHPLKLEIRGESFWKDTHLSSSTPLTHSRLMTGYMQSRGNLRLHSVMTRRRFCMLLDSCRGLHLISEMLSALAVLKLIPSLGQSFAVPSTLTMCLLDWWS